jgi:hypothetical protein
MITLWILSFPTMGCFYAFVLWIGWIDVSLGVWGWVGYALTVCHIGGNNIVEPQEWKD